MKLKEKLTEEGHTVNVERVIPVGDEPPKTKNIEFESRPEVDAYDALIFGAPVQAFSLSAVMTAYMRELPSLQNKNIACFVTKGIRFNWTGGNQAISKMKKICESKGGTVIGTGIIVWNKKREKKIGEMVEKFTRLF